jgi:hypothetical protein
MFNWGAGSSLGLLTCLGYSLFCVGAVFLWRHRQEFYYWMDAEVALLRRNLSRHVPAGPFYEPRFESRLRVIPATFYRSALQLPRRRFSWGAFLLFLGFAFFALDFFI